MFSYDVYFFTLMNKESRKGLTGWNIGEKKVIKTLLYSEITIKLGQKYFKRNKEN